MFDSFLKRLTGDDDTQLPDEDARLALGALLVRVARSDGEYATVEADHISAILTRRYGVDIGTADTLRQDAETLESEAPDTVRFTRSIKSHVALEDRASVVEDLWELVLADGTRDHEEDGLMRLVTQLLGINDRDSALARQRVIERGTS